MQELLNELQLYETMEFKYSLSHTKSIINSENIANKIIEIANKKIDSNFLQQDEKFTLYCFVFKEDKLVKLNKITFNNFKSKFFGNPKMIMLKNFINDIDKKNDLKISDYSVRFFIFQKKKKKEHNNFNKLFQTIFEKHTEIRSQYDENYFSNFENIISSFFIDSYDFFTKRILFIFGTLILYSLYYHKHELTLLGIPSDIISDVQVLSILKLYTSVLIPVFSIIILFATAYMYLLSISTSKTNLYKSFKVMSSFISYVLIIALIYHFNFFKIKKQNIDINDFFLKHYFSEGYYPRFAVDNNSSKLKLILGKKNKDIYFYNQDQLFNQKENKEICKTLENINFEQTIIKLLKSSDKIGTKNVNITNNISDFKILDANKSLEKLTHIYCTSIHVK